MIYILEDDENICKLVSYALRREGYETQGFAAPPAFWQALARAVPDLLLLDIMLPGEDGLHILARLRADARTKELPVILLTARDSEYDKASGLDAGADDYVAKPFGMVELMSRVRAVLRRAARGAAGAEGAEQTEASYRVGKLFVDEARHVIQVSGKDVRLSLKEYTLLVTLLAARGKVVRRETLLTRVWGAYYEESRTLDVHIRKLRVKLGDEVGGYIHTVKGIGYQLEVKKP